MRVANLYKVKWQQTDENDQIGMEGLDYFVVNSFDDLIKSIQTLQKEHNKYDEEVNPYPFEIITIECLNIEGKNSSLVYLSDNLTGF